MSTDETKARLVTLGVDSLAEALLTLAQEHTEAKELVLRLTATTQEILKRFNAKLAALRRSTKQVWVTESRDVAAQLRALLELLGRAHLKPEEGVRAITAFFAIDASIFSRCDDSNGCIGDVFRYEAADLWVQFGCAFELKPALANILFALISEDEYGVRDPLIKRVAEFLPEPEIRELIRRTQELAEAQTDRYRRMAHFGYAAEYARRIKDPELFLLLTLKETSELFPPALLTIARVFMESAQPEKALGWVQKIPEGTHWADSKHKLLVEIHAALGNTGEMENLAWQDIRQNPSLETLNHLVSLIGEDQRESAILKEAEAITAAPAFSPRAALFLEETGHGTESARYVLTRMDRLEHCHYESLLKLAKQLAAAEHFLAATVLYRQLMENILNKPLFDAYGHAARYLLHIEKLAPLILDWQTVKPHAAYEVEIKTRHARKTAFWSRYATAAEKAGVS